MPLQSRRLLREMKQREDPQSDSLKGLARFPAESEAMEAASRTSRKVSFGYVVKGGNKM